MIDKVLKIIAPHHCYSCGKIGERLCDNCKYDITLEPYTKCLQCLRIVNMNGNCSACRLPYSRSWAVAERTDVLRKLLDGYKFEHERGSARVLADLLNVVLPFLPENIVVTYIPTTSKHIRERGFDHAKLLAKEFAKLRRLECRSTLVRLTNDRQLGANKRVRREQAAKAFSAKAIPQGTTCLLLDDIFTTGATLSAASEKLRVAGAEDVWIAVIARQPLD